MFKSVSVYITVNIKRYNMKDIKIRPVKLCDIPDMLKIYEYYIINTAITFEYVVPTIEEFTGRVRQVMQRYPYLVAEVEGYIVGYAYANILKDRKAYEWSVETSIYVNHTHRSLGIGQQLYFKLFEYLKNQGVLAVYACITTPLQDDQYCDCSSYTYHKYLGFSEVGRFPKAGYKFNTWYDIVWMHMELEEYSTPIEPIRYFKDISKLES